MAVRSIRLISIGVAALHIAFLLYAMVYMAGGLFNFLHPASLLFAVWGISPITFLAWRLKFSLIWLIALIPIVGAGSYLVYEMAFLSNSSTSALGWIFYPLYEWAFIGLVAVAKVLIARE